MDQGHMDVYKHSHLSLQAIKLSLLHDTASKNAQYEKASISLVNKNKLWTESSTL